MRKQYIITFQKPYKFEEKDYTEIDLSNLEKLTTKDLVEADTQFSAEGNFAVMNEMSIGYTAIVAAKVTQKPIEFFHSLPANEGIKVKNIIMGFLNG